MTIKKAYYYFFYKLYLFAVSISDDAINEWKPLTTILVLEVLLISEFFIWYIVATKSFFVINNPLACFLPVITILGIANYFFFIHKGRWKKYVDEFKIYDKKRKSLGGIIVFLVIAIIFASVFLAYYQLSQINWKLYR